MKKAGLIAGLLTFALAASPAVAKTGDLIVAEYSVDQLSRVNPKTGEVTAIHTGAPFAAASYLTFEPSGKVVMTDEAGGGVYRVNPRTGDVSTVVQLTGPYGIDRAANGDLVVFDYETDDLNRVDPRSGALDLITSGGLLDGNQYGLETLLNGQTLIADQTFDRIIRVAKNGNQSIFTSDARFDEIADIMRAPNGAFYAVDQAGTLFRISKGGAVTSVASDLGTAYGVALAPSGKLYVGDYNGGRISEVNPKTGDVNLVADTDLTGVVGIEVEPPKCKGKFATIVGSKKNDKLKGSKFKDVIVGLKGNDKLTGGKGKDLICGGKGKDKLNGQGGKDKLDGGPGKDTERQ